MLLPFVALGLRQQGLRRLQQQMARLPFERRYHADSPDALIRRVARALDVAARRGPWPANCLERSVVLWWMLRRRGLAADLLIGVRRRPGRASGSRTLDFHAWVEHEGLVVNDVADVRSRFVTFERPIAPPDVEFRPGGLTPQ